MYPFDSQGKTENYRSCPSTLQKQERAALCRDLTVTEEVLDVLYKRLPRAGPGVPPGKGRRGRLLGCRAGFLR